MSGAAIGSVGRAGSTELRERLISMLGDASARGRIKDGLISAGPAAAFALLQPTPETSPLGGSAEPRAGDSGLEISALDQIHQQALVVRPQLRLGDDSGSDGPLICEGRVERDRTYG